MSADETGFELERSTDGGLTFVPLLTLPADATGHVDSAGLAPGTDYQYHVRAVTDAGGGLASAWSNVAAATTPPDVGQPSPPAAPSEPRRSPPAPTSVNLTWTDNAADETSVIVERATNGGAVRAARDAARQRHEPHRRRPPPPAPATRTASARPTPAGASAASNESAADDARRRPGGAEQPGRDRRQRGRSPPDLDGQLRQRDRLRRRMRGPTAAASRPSPRPPPARRSTPT